jgi:ABC-type proline/glycine betaine transport system substrate-binding protein
MNKKNLCLVLLSFMIALLGSAQGKKETEVEKAVNFLKMAIHSIQLIL